MTLEELEAQRAARKDPQDLPHTMTRGEVADYVRQTSTLDGRITTARGAQATLASLRSNEDDVQWLDFLGTTRTTLVDERMSIKSPIRDRKLLERARNLEFSLSYIDHGLTTRMAGSTFSLETSRLGELMREAGYEGWCGSLKEVEHRVREVERRRAAAQAQLDTALMDDDERERREADANALRDAFNSMRVKHAANGEPGLRVVDRDNQDVDEATLTPLQRRALALAREALLGEAATR